MILCPRHHAEIHSIYDELITADKWLVGRPLSYYSWRQAERLMSQLEAACDKWLKEETPGIDPKTFADNRPHLKRRRHR